MQNKKVHEFDAHILIWLTKRTITTAYLNHMLLKIFPYEQDYNQTLSSSQTSAEENIFTKNAIIFVEILLLLKALASGATVLNRHNW